MKRSSSLMQAAVVLNNLPTRQAALILARLKPRDVQAVLDAVTRLNDVSANEIAEALERLRSDARRWKKSGDHERPGLQPQAPEPTAPRQPEGPFDFLIEMIPAAQAKILGDEHPENIAIVLSLLPPAVASQIMKRLDPCHRISALKRICELEEVSQQRIAELSFALKSRQKKILKSQQANLQRVNVAADLLSFADSKTRESLLVGVDQSDPDLAQRIRQSMLQFEQLELLSNREVKTLLKHVDTASWAPALKNGHLGVLSKLQSNMAPRAAAMLSADIDQIGYIDSHTEQAAQQDVIRTLLNLIRAGKIEMPVPQDLSDQSIFTPIG